jgi:para-nitrobenzyl esterase
VAFQENIARTFAQDPGLVPPLGEISEDCLYLNLWTSNLDGPQPKPVMVWIHGGSNISGSGRETPYDGANLASKEVVVVTINYRLNIFGFLAHPQLSAESPQASSGNYGLLDQIAALEWVQRNIAAFGGDPQRVTIFGESAGAVDVAYLMASPLAEGLFHRAISQSGGYAVADFRTLAEEEVRGVKLAEAVGLGESEDQLANLRSIEAGKLMAEAFQAFPNGLGSAPNTDGWVLTEAPGHLFKAGRQHDVPLMIGVNSNEWTTLRYYTPKLDLNGFGTALMYTYGDQAEQAFALYPAETEEDLQGATDDWLTDLWFVGPSKLMADWMDNVPSATYFYVFSRRLPVPGGDDLGAYHAAELAYVFDNLDDEPWVPRQEYDTELAEIISAYWVQFATTGDPNIEDQHRWPAYSVEAGEYLELGDEVVARSHYRPEVSAIYSAMLERRMAAGQQQ